MHAEEKYSQSSPFCETLAHDGSWLVLTKMDACCL